MKNLSSTLTSSNHRNRSRCGTRREYLGYCCCILRRMNDTRMVGIQALRYARPSSNCDDNIPRTSEYRFAGRPISRFDLEIFNCTGLRIRFANIDSMNIVPVVNNVVEMVRTPPHVILILDPLWEKSPQIGELHQPVVTVKVVEKSELASWIPQGRQVFDERDLHLCTGKQHSSMPSELLLALNETNFQRSGCHSSAMVFDLVMERYRNCQRSWTKSNTDQVVYLVVIESL